MRAPVAAVRLAGLALVTLALAMPSGTQADGDSRRQIVLAVTSQLRGSVSSRILEPDRSPGGLAHLAVLIRRARELVPDLVLLDAGNALAGAPDALLPAAAAGRLSRGADDTAGRLSRGADNTAGRLSRGADDTDAVPPILAAMNRLRYDAAILAERELDRTSGALATALAASTFPWLGANVLIAGAAEPPSRRTLARGQNESAARPKRIGREAQTAQPRSANSTAIRAAALVERAGVRLGVIGLASPGVLLGKEPEIRERIRIADAEEAAGNEAARLRSDWQADVVIAVGAGSAADDAERESGLLEDLPLPNAAGVIADRTAGLDLVIAGRGRMPRKDAVARPNRSYSVPLIEPVPSSRALTLVVLDLEREGGRWRVAQVTQETQWAEERADPDILAAMAGALEETRQRLAQRLPIYIAGRASKRAFQACAGVMGYAAALHAGTLRPNVSPAGPDVALSAEALGDAQTAPPSAAAEPVEPPSRRTLAQGQNKSAARPREIGREPPTAQPRGANSPVRGADSTALSLLPALWTPPRWTRRDFGRQLTFSDVFRWFGQDDPLVMAELTGRQIAQLLEPYVRQMHGWQTPASHVLYPGGLDVALAPKRSEAASLRLAGTPEPLQDSRTYSLWMTRYHRFGGGGLAARALIEPDQRARLQPLTLRDAVLEFLGDAGAPLPEACASILSRQVPEKRPRRTRTRSAVSDPAPDTAAPPSA